MLHLQLNLSTEQMAVSSQPPPKKARECDAKSGLDSLDSDWPVALQTLTNALQTLTNVWVQNMSKIIGLRETMFWPETCAILSHKTLWNSPYMEGVEQ